MDNRNIIKRYQQVCAELKTDKSEDAKQKYLIIFKELDLQLNNELETGIERNSYTGSTLRDEIKRIEAILSMLKYRREFRSKMTDEYVRFIGYNPIDLEELPHMEDEPDYVAYKTNLIIANEIMSDLIKSSKRVNSLKNSITKKNKTKLLKELEALQDERSSKLQSLKDNKEVLDDLYDYCITAPFNDENAYIQYLLIKISPSGTLKIKLGDTPKRNIKKHEQNNSSVKPTGDMPIIPQIGSVRPNNILKYMEDSVSKFDDIVVPTNGLIDNTTEVQISPESIVKNK